MKTWSNGLAVYPHATSLVISVPIHSLYLCRLEVLLLFTVYSHVGQKSICCLQFILIRTGRVYATGQECLSTYAVLARGGEESYAFRSLSSCGLGAFVPFSILAHAG